MNLRNRLLLVPFLSSLVDHARMIHNVGHTRDHQSLNKVSQ